eukprot:10863808-Alexandrium_andersonii.AAC.1
MSRSKRELRQALSMYVVSSPWVGGNAPLGLAHSFLRDCRARPRVFLFVTPGGKTLVGCCANPLVVCCA